MIHHLSVGTNDLARSGAFYDPLMALLGLRRIRSDAQSIDYGTSDILFSVETPTNGQPATPGNGVHVAFAARDRATVDSFHRLALAHGGTDAGIPGLRPTYDAHYYGAFVLDPEGNKVEAVTYAAG
jgi:catechol 2,3-dioxygenase-like lactoylglutathione lyase family enzyme